MKVRCHEVHAGAVSSREGSGAAVRGEELLGGSGGGGYGNRRAQEEERRKAEERRQRRVIGLLVALLIGLLIWTLRSILLAQELEAAKRAQIRQANMNMATMVAGTVLSQLRALSDAVERVASEEEAARALEAGDWTTLQNISKATYEFYEDPSHGLKPSGISPFDAWTFMNKDGDQRAKFGKARPAGDRAWLAGFAPVGHTGFVVIVQTRETEATSGTSLFLQLAKWAIPQYPRRAALAFHGFLRA